MDSIGSNSQSVCKKVINIQQIKINCNYSIYLNKYYKLSNNSIYIIYINL